MNELDTIIEQRERIHAELDYNLNKAIAQLKQLCKQLDCPHDDFSDTLTGSKCRDCGLEVDY